MKFKILITLILVFASDIVNCNPISSPDSAWLKAQIITDLHILNSIYGCIIHGEDDVESRQIKILSMEKEDVNSGNKFPQSCFYKIQVKIDVAFLYTPLHDTIFTYYVVETEGNYYRLFGYFTSEILIWQSQYYSSVQGKNTMINIFNKSRLFTSGQKNEIKKFLKGNRKEFSRRFDLVSTILQIYFGKNELYLAKSVILQPEIREKILIKWEK